MPRYRVGGGARGGCVAAAVPPRGGALFRPPSHKPPAGARHRRGRADAEGPLQQQEEDGPAEATEPAGLGHPVRQRSGRHDRQRHRLVGAKELRLAARGAVGGRGGGALPPRHARDPAGGARAVRRVPQPDGAVAVRGAARHRTPRDRALQGPGAQLARDAVPRSDGDPTRPASGGRGLDRCRAAARLAVVQGRGDSSHRDRAVPHRAAEAVSRRVLVVDDEKGIREALQQVLEFEEIEVQTCPSGGEALLLYAEFRPHLVFLDVKMQGMDGLETLRKLRELDARAQVVMISGHGTIQTAVEATQLGAYDFLEKPLDNDRILLTLRNALQHLDLESENVRLKAEVHAHYEIVGSSKAVKQVIERLEKVAPTGARVLITGENGTGKELVARAIHAFSPRGPGPFVEVNCAAIPSELIESELFGHMKGSFTGAFADRAGKFELADGGTLFLDEIGDMSLSAQAKVLRALQEGVITRVGSGKAIHVDVRVIAATNKRLDEEIHAGRFREDLLYRLNVVPIHVPPLRERKGDVPGLVQHFADQLAQRAGLPARGFAPEALKRLQGHDC